MKHIFALTLCICTAVAAHAQNPGYFNRKNVLEFSFNAQTPLFSNIKYFSGNDFLAVKNDVIRRKTDNFDFGIRFAYMHTLKRDLGIGLEFGYDYYSVQREARNLQYGFYNGYNYFENIDVSSMMIMPKLEFSNKGSVLPMGIAHQIGIGFRIVKPLDKEYHYTTDNWYSNYSEVEKGPAIPLPEQYKYKGSSVKGVTLMYAVNMRTPLSKRLFLNYGLRYTINLMSSPSSIQVQNDNENNKTLEMTTTEFNIIARQRKQLSFIQASIGISFAF